MKKIYSILGAALLIISICIIYLALQGVSLRSEPIIKPSPIDTKYQNITYGVFHRMFPSFQKTDYVVWGVSTETTREERTVFELLQNEHAMQLGKKPQVLQVTETTLADKIKKCTKPCWLVVKPDQASSLVGNEVLNLIRSVLGENYFSITFLEFNREMSVPANCEKEQRLDFSCILPVSVREVRKHVKDIAIRYFFMRRYNEIDYFLFLEKAQS